MKKLSVLSSGLLLTAAALSSCHKGATPPKDCAQVMCTMDFRTVSVYLRDAANAPFRADSTATFLPDGTRHARVQAPPLPYPGSYSVLDDSWVRTAPNSKTQVRFVAYKSGQAVADVPFVIGTDCCHVSKISGPDTLVVTAPGLAE